MKILKINPESLKTAVEVIEKSGVVVFPTDTVYGLVADAFNESVVEKIFKIKQRKKNNPLPVFVKDIESAKKLTYISNFQEAILKKFWPGKLTAVSKVRDVVFPEGIVADAKIGLRVPDYDFLNGLLEKMNRPLIATSANIAGRKASGKIKEILEQFANEKNQPDLVLDAGDLEKSLPSTVVDLEDSKVLRKGGIGEKEIMIFLKK